jgi:hypothetical protein
MLNHVGLTGYILGAVILLIGVPLALWYRRRAKGPKSGL